MQNDDDNWYRIADIARLDTPALVIYPERVQANIRALTDLIGDVSRLRPHAKTHKSPEAVRLQLDAGIRKFKCATIAEAEMLGRCHAPDVLLAYQPQGPKLGRLIALIREFPDTDYSCLVDNLLSAHEISSAALAAGIRLPVYIDLNVGQNRTGIHPGEALALYAGCRELGGIRVHGLHAYDGHLHQADLRERTRQCNSAFAPVDALRAEILKRGYPRPVIIAGGSPTFPIHAQRAGVECSPGTYIYWDRGYSLACAEQPFVPAALLIARIVSQPNETTLCLDLGHKSVSAENELAKRVYFLNAPELEVISQSEEHLVVQAGSGHPYQVGDVLYGLPYHICPTVALYERGITVEKGHITGEWRHPARDRKITV